MASALWSSMWTCAAPGARGVQAESAEKAEAIQHLRAFGEMRHGFVIRLLIEIHAGLVAADRDRFRISGRSG